MQRNFANEKGGSIMLHDSKSHYKAIVIKTELYKKDTNQLSTAESQETNPHIYIQFVTKNIMKKGQFLQ